MGASVKTVDTFAMCAMALNKDEKSHVEESCETEVEEIYALKAHPCWGASMSCHRQSI